MTPADVAAALADPFPPAEVHLRPQNAKGNRALALAYIDARQVMDRLDAVVGLDGWADAYEVLPTGSVVCRLRVRVAGAWVEKADVGSLSEQPDEGDKLKAAFSDALKRAAVKFGIGRYLYALPALWADYDPAKKQFVGVPQLPAWARPAPKPAAPPPAISTGKPAPEPLVLTAHERTLQGEGETAAGDEDAAPAAELAELRVRLQDYADASGNSYDAVVETVCAKFQARDLHALTAGQVREATRTATQRTKQLIARRALDAAEDKAARKPAAK